MSIDFARRACIAGFALILSLTTIACVGPQGPPGPAGAGSGGGPPYVWVCTPAQYANAGGTTPGDIYVFNGGATTANVALNILDRDGNNLAGATVPGSSPAATYPGETGASTLPLAAAHTRDVSFFLPVTSGAGFDGVTHVSASVRVTSDQPIAVGSNFQFSGYHPVPCSQLPK